MRGRRQLSRAEDVVPMIKIGRVKVRCRGFTPPAITWRPIGELRAGIVKARRPRDSAGEAKRRALHGAEHSSNI